MHYIPENKTIQYTTFQGRTGNVIIDEFIIIIIIKSAAGDLPTCLRHSFLFPPPKRFPIIQPHLSAFVIFEIVFFNLQCFVFFNLPLHFSSLFIRHFLILLLHHFIWCQLGQHSLFLDFLLQSNRPVHPLKLPTCM